MPESTLDDYVRLIRRFLAQEITALEFEKEYLHRFINETTSFPENIFLPLDGLFADVDFFCADPNLRGADDLDEPQLREACRKTLKKLGVD